MSTLITLKISPSPSAAARCCRTFPSACNPAVFSRCWVRTARASLRWCAWCWDWSNRPPARWSVSPICALATCRKAAPRRHPAADRQPLYASQARRKESRHFAGAQARARRSPARPADAKALRGENQRVLLARALLNKTAAAGAGRTHARVDVNGQLALYDLIDQLRKELGCAVLMVSHDLHLVMAKTDEVLCLNQHICCPGHRRWCRCIPNSSPCSATAAQSNWRCIATITTTVTICREELF